MYIHMYQIKRVGTHLNRYLFKLTQLCRRANTFYYYYDNCCNLIGNKFYGFSFQLHFFNLYLCVSLFVFTSVCLLSPLTNRLQSYL